MKPRKLFSESPIGRIEAPQWIAEEIFNETDKKLLKNMEHNGFIDPFRYAEARRRGIK